MLAMAAAQACSRGRRGRPGRRRRWMVPVSRHVGGNDLSETTQEVPAGGHGAFGPPSGSIFAPVQAASVESAAVPLRSRRRLHFCQPSSIGACPIRDDTSTIRAQPVALPNLIREPGQPWRLRRLVEVVNYGVLVDAAPSSGKLQGVEMGNAETSAPEGFAFAPRSGGALTWDNEDRAGTENVRVREAARFGEVNAYYYADGVIAYANICSPSLASRHSRCCGWS